MLLQLVHLLPSILCSILFLLAIDKWRRRNATNSGSKLNLPPGPKKLPIIGNLHLMLGNTPPHRRLSELARKYGPVVQLQFGELFVVMVSTPETAMEALKTQELNFSQRPSLLSATLPDLDTASVILAPYGDYWRQMRKIAVLELLSARRVRSFRFIREQEVKSLIEQVSSTSGSIFNLSKKITALTNNVISKAAFGPDFKLDQQEQLMGILRDVVEVSGGFSGGFNLAEMYPSIKIFRYIHGMKRKIDDLTEKMDSLFERILDEHKRKRENSKSNGTGQDKDNNSSSDLIDVLLSIQDYNEMGYHVTKDHIKGAIRDLFIAGTETSSVAIEWAVSEMLRNPTVMKKAQAEVREALQGKEHIEESDIEGLKYLKLVIKETLRLHPPVPVAPRESRASCKMSGYDVPVNSMVLIHVWAIGRDPRYWREPEKFEPERFLESSVDFMGTNFQFLPFGAGRRMCPGIAFSSATMELPLAAMLYHFDWKLPAGRNPNDLDMSEAFGATVKRKNDLYVTATRVL